MADLSFLFQETKPQGMMAGYLSGLQNTYKEQELANQQAYADEARFRTKRGEALLDTDLAKAKWETNPEVQQAGLEHTKSQTEETRQKTYFEQFKGWQDSQINFLQDSYAQAQGPGRAAGGDIVMNMKARLENDIKTATNPQTQQLAQKRLQGFMEDPRISKIANMTNEEILAEIPKAIENIALKDPQYIRQKALDDAKNAARLQEHRIMAGATKNPDPRSFWLKRGSELGLKGDALNVFIAKMLRQSAPSGVPVTTENYIETPQGKVPLPSTKKGESGNTNKSETSVSNW